MEALVDIEESIHVDATPDAVWQVVTDVRRHPEYAGPKSITKVIDFGDTLHVGARWVAHEKFGPQKFDAPSEVTTWDPGHEFGWVSFPPAKGAWTLKTMYAVLRLPVRQRHGILTTLANIKSAAEKGAA